MSAFQSHVPSAIAFQLTARLELYEQDMSHMLACPTDPDLYHRVSQHMDEMRLYAASLPELSVTWVELLIRHFELTHALWRWRQGSAGKGEEERIRQQHAQAVRRLARKCAQLMPLA